MNQLADPQTMDQQPDPSAQSPATPPTTATESASSASATGSASTSPDPFDAALDQSSNEIGADLQAQSDKTAAGENLMQKGLDFVNQLGLGMVKGTVDTANTVGDLLHLPAGKGVMETPLIQNVYADSAELNRRSGVNGFADTTGQFAIGLLGVGKVFDALKIGEIAAKAGVAGKLGNQVAQGAAAAYAALDPHTGRLSDLIEQVPALRNPVNAYLASNPNDSAADGRLKNAIEGAGLDVAMTGVLSLALKTFKVAGAVVKGTAPKADLDSAINDLDAATQGRAPGTGHMGDDQVAPTDPAAAPAPDAAAPQAKYQTPPPSGEPDVAAAPEAAPTHPAATAVPDVADPQQVADAIVNHGRTTGDFKGKLTGDAKQAATSAIPTDAPRIETNSIGYTVIPHKAMVAAQKAAGMGNVGEAVAVAGKDGVVISDKLLKMAPADQAKILAHETGHVLQPQFMDNLKATGQTLDKGELKAASQALRPDHYAAADAGMAAPKAGARAKGAALSQYLNKGEEQFADSFALWKTDPAKMAEVAPNTKALFDQHFAPWIDTDLTTLAGDTALARKQGMVGKPLMNEVKAIPDQVAAKDDFSPRMQMQDTDTQALMKSYEADQAALTKYGSRESAEQAGYKFGQSNLPWQKLAGDGAYQQFHDTLASEFKATLDQMKGGSVLSDARVNDLVSQRVKLFNEDPSEVLGEIQAMGHNANGLVANMEAAFAIANKAGDDLYQLTKNLKVGNYSDFGGDEAAAKAALNSRMTLFVEAIGNAQSMRSAIGRGMRRMRGEFAITPELLKTIKSMDPDQIASMVEMSGGDPRMMAQMATKGFWDRAVRAAGTLYANNLLWMWPTHARNMAGNIFMLATSPAMRAVGSVALGSAGNDVRTMAVREYRYMFSAVGDAFETSKEAYLRGDSLLNPHSNEFFRDADNNMPTDAGGKLALSMGMKPMHTLGDVFHNGMRGMMFAMTQPTRALGMADEFIKQMSYRGSVLSKASLDADKLGLQGPDYTAFLQKALDNSMDENGHALDADALYDAQVRTFQQPLLPGTTGADVAAIVGKHPAMRLILPFVRTPINLFRYAVKLSPGLNLLQGEYRQMLTGQLGKSRMADAYGQMMLGSTAVASIGAMASAGMITGGAPPNPEDARALADTGWKPYSFIYTKGAGSHEYIPFNQVDPIGMLFGVVADTMQIYQQGQVSDQTLDKLALPIVLATMKNIVNRTYLQSLSQTFDALTDPTNSAPRMIGSMAASAVPFSSLLREVNPDPYTRDARGIVDSVMANLPGFSQNLPPRRDAFGAPVLRTTNVVFADKPNDIVDAEQQRMLTNFGIGITPPVAQPKGNVDLRSYQLPNGQTAFDRYQEISQQPKGVPETMKEALAKEIKSPIYQAMPDGDGSTPGTKLTTLNKIASKYREAAFRQLLQENPPLAVQIGAKQQAVRQAFRSNLASGQGNADKYNAVISSGLKQANAAFGIK